MDRVMTPERVRYVVEGEQTVGVLLNLVDYQRLRAALPPDPEMIVNMSHAELQVLAHGMLAPSRQDRLNGLLQKNREGTLNDAERKELDDLLEQVDMLNVLKARAMYTLQQRQGFSPG